MSLGLAVWVAFAFFLGSMAQTLSGFGFTLVALPLLSVAVSPRDALVGQTFASGLLTFYMAYQLRSEADRDVLKRILPASILGMPFGLWLANQVDDQGLRIAVGVSVLIGATLIATGWRLRKPSPTFEYLAGFVSGTLATSAGPNGPPLVVTLAARDHPPARFRATMQIAFAVSSAVSMALFYVGDRITETGLRIAAIGFVPSLIARVVGEPIFRRLDPARFRSLVIVMLFAAGAVALARALFGN